MSHKNRSLQWACQLTARPARVLDGEQVELTVALSSEKFGELDLREHRHFYEGLRFRFSSDHPDLDARLNFNNLDFTQVKGRYPVFLFQLPHIADGSYGITVKVTKMHGHDARFAASAEAAQQHREQSASDLELLNEFPDDEPGVSGFASIQVANRFSEIRADVSLQRSSSFPTSDEGLWAAVRNRTAAIEFERYKKFIDAIFSEELGLPGRSGFRNLDENVAGVVRRIRNSPAINIYGPYAYSVLKLATQAFLMMESGVVIRDNSLGKVGLLSVDVLEKERIRLGEPNISFSEINQRLGQYLAQSDHGGTLPYLDRILRNLVSLNSEQENVDEVLPYFNGVLQHRLTSPSLIELIWSYWHEEGMLVQTMNTVALRFQNRRSDVNDPLGELELDPLRPLNNLIWGYIQDEHNRLTVPRRACEYQHQYGLSLVGKAVSDLIPIDVRSKFIEAFHNLLYRTAVFYREDADTTVIADAFPLLNALKEVHLLLAEGAHNQFGDLPWTSRGEMLIMQWLLARPEMREFLRGRYMVPYQEEWMGAVDCMKKLKGWTDTTVTHFHELAVTGERILLSIRYGDWIDIENTQEQAKNWARYWKPEIQRYMHGYMTATGVDLMADITDTREGAVRFLQPSALLQQRLQAQSAQLPPRLPRAAPSRVGGFAESAIQSQSRMLRYRKDD